MTSRKKDEHDERGTSGKFPDNPGFPPDEWQIFERLNGKLERGLGHCIGILETVGVADEGAFDRWERRRKRR